MKYNDDNKPLVCMMTQSTCYRGTYPMDVKGVLWHSTGANQTGLWRYVQPDDNAPNKTELLKLLGKNNNRNDWNHKEVQAGLNAWIGKLEDGTVTTVQTMPWNYKPWGCGGGSKGSCNSGWIQFEICEDGLTNKDYFNAVYTEACELTAYLCKMYNIDPNGYTMLNGVKVPNILCHRDSCLLGLGSNHGDVMHWFPKFGKNMDTVRADVAALMGSSTAPVKKEESSVTPAEPVQTGAFKEGDVVKIVGDKYYSGAVIPSWVKNKTWIVYDVDGARVVINKSTDGANSIMSPINASGLALVNSSAPAVTPQPAPATKPQEQKPVETITEVSYTVVRGDTLSEIAAKYNTTYQELAKYNNISNPSLINVGQVIKIPTKAQTTTTAPAVDNTIRKGDTVKIVGTKYYSGATIPSWVKNKQWIVYEAIDGNNRIVINKSADGANAIMSPINRNDLELVKKA